MMVSAKICFGVFIAVALSTQAAGQTPALGARDPSDPLQTVPGVSYRPITSGSKSFRPIDPLPWRGVNDRVAPQPQPEAEKK